MFSTLNDWQLSRKMLAAFAFIAVLLAALASMAIYTNRQLTQISTLHYAGGIAGQERLGALLDQIREQRILVYSYHGAKDADDARSLEQRFAKNKQALVAAVAAYHKVEGADLAETARALDGTVARLNEAADRIFAVRAKGDLDASLALIKGPGKEASHDAIELATKLRDMTSARSARADDRAQQLSSQMLVLTLVLAFGALGVLALIWLLVSRTVSRPMSELSYVTTTLAEGGRADVPYQERGDEIGAIAKAVESFRAAAVNRAEADARLAAEQQLVTSTLETSLELVAEGDLSVEVTADFPPAYVRLKDDFNAALASLRNLIGTVGESASEIRTGSSEIAQASEDLARRTESNAASLEQTSAAIAQIDSRIKATAEAATRTVDRADEAIATVSGGRAIVDEAVQAMGRVSDSAKGIDSVIEGLDKIAFQTRVLAMNAAVEAGRAGEAGRGFAVVADLVSALAMRAEEESKRARDQLTVTQHDIVTAVDAVQKVDGALADISSDVGEVHQLLGTMAADNQAQATAMTEISAAVTSMDQATQQNAAMVEQTSAAARNLTREVDNLAEQAAQFRTGREAARKGAPKPAPAKSAGPVSFKPAQANGAAKPYVSLIKPLPALGMVNGNGAQHAADDWKDF